MALLFYNIFLVLYRAGISIASLWNAKAKLWIKGRKDIVEKIISIKHYKTEIIWIHCSSLGEFEQGRPVIEKLKAMYPSENILLTFFSPSGYEIRKNYEGAAWVFYLPLDSYKTANRVLEILDPLMMVFVKYDYWYYYLTECKKRKIPLLMTSAIFRKEQSFFKWYGGLHRKMLSCFTHFFVQDEDSKQLLNQLNIHNVTTAGDTRFDRVAEIAENFKPIEKIEKFCGNSQVLIAGSTWFEDERIIKEAVNDFPGLKVIIAPHEIHEEHLQKLKTIFPAAIFYSQLIAHHSQFTSNNCLIIDNIGMLSRLYHYATISYIGGGFNKGIHNTLEAAVYGKPVLFGPNYKKFKEAIGLIETGGGICISSAIELSENLKKLLGDKDELIFRSKKSFEFVKENRGATEKIINYIDKNRLLTS